MIKQRILQLVAISLCCVVIVGCKPNKVEQAEETPLDPTEIIVSQTDSAKISSAVTDSLMIKSANTDSLKEESAEKAASSDDDPKGAEVVAKDEMTSDEVSVNKDKKNETEINDSTSRSDAATTDAANTDSVVVDTTVVDSLWRRLLEDVKIVSDTTLNQADSDSVNRDSLLEVAKNEKLDSLVIGVIKPTNPIGGATRVSGSWPWWITVLAGVVGLLFGGLLMWLISRSKRKREPSSDDEKETKLKLKIQDFSDLVDGDKNKRLIEFYKRMIIKKDK